MNITNGKQKSKHKGYWVERLTRFHQRIMETSKTKTSTIP